MGIMHPACTKIKIIIIYHGTAAELCMGCGLLEGEDRCSARKLYMVP
jgi:hypothetical protein